MELISKDSLLTTIPVVMAIVATLPNLLVGGQGKYAPFNTGWLAVTLAALVAAFGLTPFFLTAAFWTTTASMVSALGLFMVLFRARGKEERATEPSAGET